MTKKYSEQLLTAFDDTCRKDLSMSLSQAYLLSHQASKEFGSFWRQAQSYLRWFYVDTLVEKTARKLSIDIDIASNTAKNCVHPTLNSANWSLTVHHLQGRGPLPRNAKYRATYLSLNYDLFEDISFSSSMDGELGGHVFMLHDGKNQSLSLLNFTIPTADNSGIIYTEALPIISPDEVEAESVDDELDTKFKLLTEQHIRMNSK